MNVLFQAILFVEKKKNKIDLYQYPQVMDFVNFFKKNQIQITEMYIQTELYQLFNSNFEPYTKANILFYNLTNFFFMTKNVQMKLKILCYQCFGCAKRSSQKILKQC